MHDYINDHYSLKDVASAHEIVDQGVDHLSKMAWSAGIPGAYSSLGLSR
ncbi:hypothetical protein [Lysobacter sp. A378]